jgi:hypothetical protein
MNTRLLTLYHFCLAFGAQSDLKFGPVLCLNQSVIQVATHTLLQGNDIATAFEAVLAACCYVINKVCDDESPDTLNGQVTWLPTLCIIPLFLSKKGREANGFI